MARAGMARWRAKNSSGPAEGGDEVQRSLELLDRVLSEFDDLENGNATAAAAAAGAVAAGPPSKAAAAAASSVGGSPQPPEGLPGGGAADDGGGAADADGDAEGDGGGAARVPESPLGHQSEDDGYMSMNGRRPAKLALDLPLAPAAAPPQPAAPGGVAASAAHPPPPPEEAERIISTLLPRLSPGSCAALGRRPVRPFLLSGCGGSQEALTGAANGCRVTTATQTTLPKTRVAGQLSVSSLRFSSLPPDSALQRAARRLPPRTVPGACAAERHREVRRRRNDDNFSDDSLEAEPVGPPAREGAGLPPPPPPTSPAPPPPPSPSPSPTRRPQRPPVAWEVALHDQPGSTRVVGRRRRRSADHIASGQRGRGRVVVERRAASTEDDSASASATPSSDGGTPEWPRARALPAHGTYVIRKGRRREALPLPLQLPQVPPPPALASASSAAGDSESSPPSGELKRCSSTFDNIRSLLNEGRLEGLDEPPPDFPPPAPPALVRVVSLPSLPVEPPPLERSRSDGHRLSRLHELAVTLEEDDDDDADVAAAAGATVLNGHRSPHPEAAAAASAAAAGPEGELASPSGSRDGYWRRDDAEGSSVDEAEGATGGGGGGGGCYFLRGRGHGDAPSGGQAVSDVENKRRLSQCEEAIRCIIEGDRRPESDADLLFPLANGKDESLDFSDADDRRATSQSEELSSCNSLDVPASSSREDMLADSSLDEEALTGREAGSRSALRARRGADVDRVRVRDGDPGYRRFALDGERSPHDGLDDGLPEASSADHDADVSSLNSTDINGKLSQEDSLEVTPSPSHDEGVNCCSTQGSSADEAAASRGGGDDMSEEEARLIRQLRREHLQLQHPVDVPRPRRDYPTEPAQQHAVRLEVRPPPPPRSATAPAVSSAAASGSRQEDYRAPDASQHAQQVTVSADLEFPPLPPSPVEEAEDEYSEILPGLPGARKADPPKEEAASRQQQPPPPPPHQHQHPHPPDAANSLRTRSMDAGFGRAARGHGSRREVPCERRTLPPELPPHRRPRAYAPRSPAAPSPAPAAAPGGLQTSCSLPETPIFARGSGFDVPRTPLRRGAPLLPELPAGGPGRGWYPRHRARPASSEHLDRLGPAGSAAGAHHHHHAHHHPPWDAARKPTTLPPNLSPKFFHRSPREALRRVTSLLIRKGSSSKESKKEQLSPTGLGMGSESRHKRGFFRSLWKRSRHYSLEQQ
ncbi:protein PRRC2A [Schistocerca gregaria]|uniref:protein PRRC2A n=1 Tax=Schistocerca gregaria TaxID=7010 RepID=UPI00211E4B23|nr:protein PRRC2A [Schistocerca gregaria]